MSKVKQSASLKGKLVLHRGTVAIEKEKDNIRAYYDLNKLIDGFFDSIVSITISSEYELEPMTDDAEVETDADY